MFELQGKYNTAKVFANSVEPEAISQIIEMLNQPFIKGSQVRIMADTHAGAGCTIGTTITLKDKVVPNLVGVDIGCGMLAVKLKETEVDLPKLDEVIQKKVPSGFNVHDEIRPFATPLDCERLNCWGKPGERINEMLAYRSVGTLGGGEVLATGTVNSRA